MVELTEQAGLIPPEFDSANGEVIVRFRPTRYIPPSRISHDLSSLQRELLQVLAQASSLSLKQIIDRLTSKQPERTVQDNLQMLRRLGLVDIKGKGRGAHWTLK